MLSKSAPTKADFVRLLRRIRQNSGLPGFSIIAKSYRGIGSGGRPMTTQQARYWIERGAVEGYVLWTPTPSHFELTLAFS